MSQFMKICIFLILLGFNFAASTAQAKANHLIEQRFIDIKKAPSKQDWRYFLGQSDKWRKKLWQTEANKGNGYLDWKWEWRLGWVKACTKNKAVWCDDILRRALLDRAAVVRGEAAIKVATKYRNTKNQDRWLNRLKIAYKMRQNYRRGKPLFVHKKIKSAISYMTQPTKKSPSKKG